MYCMTPSGNCQIYAKVEHTFQETFQAYEADDGFCWDLVKDEEFVFRKRVVDFEPAAQVDRIENEGCRLQFAGVNDADVYSAITATLSIFEEFCSPN